MNGNGRAADGGSSVSEVQVTFDDFVAAHQPEPFYLAQPAGVAVTG